MFDVQSVHRLLPHGVFRYAMLSALCPIPLPHFTFRILFSDPFIQEIVAAVIRHADDRVGHQAFQGDRPVIF